MSRTLSLVVVLTTVAAAAEAATPRALSAQVEWPEGVTPELVEAGKAIYLKQGFCYTCHGYEGRGGAGANLTDDEWFHSDGSVEGILATILRGVPAGESRGGPAAVMLPKGGTQLPEDQLRAVAAFVWSLSRVDSVLPVSNRTGLMPRRSP